MASIVALTHPKGDCETVETTFVVRRKGKEAVLGLRYLVELSRGGGEHRVVLEEAEAAHTHTAMK